MLDIGKELKELRLSRGLSLKEISEITRINIKYLEYLEENNFTFLPPVYVKSFLKNYVRALNGDEKKFLVNFDAIFKSSESAEQKPSEQKSQNQTVEQKKSTRPEKEFLIGKTNILTLRNVSFVIVSLLVLIIITFLILNREQKIEKQETETKSENEIMYEEVQEKKSVNFDNIASSDSLILGIVAKDSVWVQVKMDNSVVQEAYLRIGEQAKFKAKENFQLLVGNAGGIKLFLNETELPFTGVKGSVRRLKVDKNGVELIQVKNEPKKQ